MGNLGFQEILVIVLVALLVFGPNRLPELARDLGRALSRFRSETSRSVAELKRAADVEDLDRELREISRDLRGVRENVTRVWTDSSAGGAGVRPEDAPPPTDPEAT